MVYAALTKNQMQISELTPLAHLKYFGLYTCRNIQSMNEVDVVCAHL